MSAFPDLKSIKQKLPSGGKIVDWFEQRINLSEIFSWVTTFGISYAPVNPNQPIRDAVNEAFLRPMPSYQRWPHIFGLLTFIAFLLEVVTGLLLAFFFQPSAGTAYESTRLIIRDTDIGWYIHQMHYWGGQALVLLLVIRLLRFVLHRVYRSPRELTWAFGVILFLLSIAACFTGQLLPYDQTGYWTTTRGLELFSHVPFLRGILQTLAGGPAIGPFLLIRFYLLHVVVLPLFIFLLTHLHFASVRKLGLSEVETMEDKAAPLYPGHLMNLMMILLLMFGIILTLGVLFPVPFAMKADPFNTPAGISVAWYLLPAFGLFELIPRAIAGWIMPLVMVLVFLLPFLDRKIVQGPAKKKTALLLTVIIFATLLFLTYFGYRHRG